MQRNPLLLSFLLKTVLWLPACLALWYWKAEWFTAPSAWLSGWLMQTAFPGWVQGFELEQRSLSLITRLLLDSAGAAAQGRVAVMVAEVNPLVYGFGLPLFAALYLANGMDKHVGRLFIGVLALIPFQAWGICFELLKQVAVTGGPAVAMQLGFERWQREAIVLGYQLGSLVFPALAPVGLWLGLNREFLPLLMLEGAMRAEERTGATGHAKDSR